jgi:hypothetical protein
VKVPAGSELIKHAAVTYECDAIIGLWRAPDGTLYVARLNMDEPEGAALFVISPQGVPT